MSPGVAPEVYSYIGYFTIGYHAGQYQSYADILKVAEAGMENRHNTGRFLKLFC